MGALRDAKIEVERNMSQLLTEIETNKIKIEQLNHNEQELQVKLETMQHRCTELNNDLAVESQKALIQSQEKTTTKLARELEEAYGKITELQKSLASYEKDIEQFSLKESSYVNRIESMNKEIEELNVQLTTYRQKSLTGVHNDRIHEPGALELSFRSNNGSRLDMESFMAVPRKSSLAAKKKYELKASKFKSLNNTMNVAMNQTTNRFEEMRSIFVDKRKASIPQQPEGLFLDSFKGCGYLCHIDHKILKIVAYDDNVIYIFNSKGHEPLYEIPIINIKQIVCSASNAFLYQLNFYNETTEEKEEVVLELPNGPMFFKAIQSSLYFDQETIRVKHLNIESNRGFGHSVLNLFGAVKRTAILETWLNSFTKEWESSYFVLLDSVLVKFKLPTVFYYVDYQKIMRKPRIYFLENYNIIKDENKIGLKRPYTFALKIINEKKDIVFASLMEDEKEAWVHAFN